jgi:GNAT superfamily N-acetyltransferase
MLIERSMLINIDARPRGGRARGDVVFRPPWAVATRSTKTKPTAQRAPARRPPKWRALRHDDQDDVTAVMALGQALYAEDPGARPIGKKDIARTLRRLQQEPVRGRVVVVASRDRGAAFVVGYAILCSFWSNELGGEVCTVDELYVAQHARGRGLGSGLVRGLVDGSLPWFRRAVALELEVTPGNTRARALYERLGFKLRKNASLRLLR